MIKKALLSAPLLFSLLFLLFSPLNISASDEDCLMCHGDPDLKNDRGQSLFVDSEKFQLSVHGKAGFSCTDCHADLRKVDDFPHAETLEKVACGECHAEASREFQESIHWQAEEKLNLPRVRCQDCHGTHEIKGRNDLGSQVFPLNLPHTCEKCHLEKVETPRGFEFIKQYQNSIHYKALEKAGLTISANCSHCHGSHAVKPTHDPDSPISRGNIIRTCGQCHVGIQRDYLEGVHGTDYVQGIRDVPVCADCHSEHEIHSPQELSSRVYATKVAAACSKCHDDIALSEQYGFIAARFKTYSESFHGTASKYGEKRVANCASCHGFHGIRKSSDPKSSIHPANIPETCGKCHPGAGKHFAEGKIHYIPKDIDVPKYKIPYIIKKIYIFLISGFIVIFLIFISADLIHRAVHKEKHGH